MNQIPRKLWLAPLLLLCIWLALSRQSAAFPFAFWKTEAPASSFSYSATAFNHTSTSFIRHSGVLTDAVDGTGITVSFWGKVYGADGTKQSFFEFGDQAISNPIQVYRESDNGFNALLRNASNSPFWGVASSGVILQASGWRHYLFTAGGADGSTQLYINDVDAGSGGAGATGTGTIPFASFTTGKWTIGSVADGSQLPNVGICELWIKDSKIDISNLTNRRHFITAGGKPADLTGYGSPIIYLHGDAATIGTNSGSGGNFSVTGTPVDLGADKP